MKRNSQRHSLLIISAAIVCLCLSATAKADEILDWNQHLQQALLTANQSPIVSSRTSAIVHAAIFDAVNGIERRYTPIHVNFGAPRGASRRAAASSRFLARSSASFSDSASAAPIASPVTRIPCRS